MNNFVKKTYDKPFKFEPYKDGGSLRHNATKLHEKSADYWGEISIDMNNLTNVEVIDGLHVFKLSGWKRIDKGGKTYLSVSVNRFIPEDKSGSQSAPMKAPAKPQSGKSGFDDMDDDIPF